MAKIFRLVSDAIDLGIPAYVQTTKIPGQFVATRQSYPLDQSDLLDYVSTVYPNIIWSFEGIKAILSRHVTRLWVASDLKGGVYKSKDNNDDWDGPDQIVSAGRVADFSYEGVANLVKLYWGSSSPLYLDMYIESDIDEAGKYSIIAKALYRQLLAFFSNGYTSYSKFLEVLSISPRSRLVVHEGGAVTLDGQRTSLPLPEHKLVIKGSLDIFTRQQPSRQPTAVLFNDNTFRGNHGFRNNRGIVRISDTDRSILRLELTPEFNYFVIDQAELALAIDTSARNALIPQEVPSNEPFLDSLDHANFNEHLMIKIQDNINEDTIRQAMASYMPNDYKQSIDDIVEILSENSN